MTRDRGCPICEDKLVAVYPIPAELRRRLQVRPGKACKQCIEYLEARLREQWGPRHEVKP